MAKRANVVRFSDYAPPYRAVDRRPEPATVTILPVIWIERPPRPRLTPSQRLIAAQLPRLFGRRRLMVNDTKKSAFYFGCLGRIGHFVYGADGITKYDPPPGCPWRLGNMDGGLLENGKVPDHEDGRVFWTCGGRPALWFAFFWWDRSVDRRGASNSGFYVDGFAIGEAEQAFKFACDAFPAVIKRQRHPLILQNVTHAGV